jgi:SAM-dependent methyltransferase
MRQTRTWTAAPSTGQLKFARLSSAFPVFLRPSGDDGLHAKTAHCPANPVFGHVRPIKDQHGMAASEYQSHGSGNARSAVSAATLQDLLGLRPGEAFDSLLAVHQILDAELPKGELKVYEAGGGSTSFLPSDVLCRASITVVDIDAEQLRNNDYAQEMILGDIQTYRFASDIFDLVACYNVIEHLPDVGSALTGFFHALKPGGLLVIAAPNPNSLSGVVTKYTPHWFHVWFYRHMLGKKLAGLSGQPPFPTFFHPLVLPAKLIAFAEELGMRVIYRKEHESPRFPELRARTPLFAALLDAFAAVINRLPACTSDVRRGDYHLILQKR